MRFESIEQLKERRAFLQEAKGKVKRRVVICAGTGCVAGGAFEIYEQLVELSRDAGLDVEVELGECNGEHSNGGPDYLSISGCHGFCQMGPLVHILPDDILYMQVKPKQAADIVEKTFKDGEVIEDLLFQPPGSEERQKGREDITFYNKQTRVALEACGVIDPGSVEDYIAHGGYEALTKALTEMKPEEVVAEVESSGLRGRGGGGFPTGRKWRSAIKASQESGEPVFVICNGDEGDPGAFMDRSIMEGDPFKVLEGMTIGRLRPRAATRATSTSVTSIRWRQAAGEGDRQQPRGWLPR